MLPKKKRLTTAEFDFCFKNGRRLHSPFVQVIFSKSPSFHASVVVGKKVYKNAVDRNRLRRRLYDAVRTSAASKNTFICIVKAGAAKESYKTVRQDLLDLLAKLAA